MPDVKVVAVGVKGEPGAGIGDHEASTSATHITICTSSTRPTTNLFEGRTIYETDTNEYKKYNGSSWEDMIPDPPASSDERGKLICLVELKTTSQTIASGTVQTVIFNTVHQNEGDVYNNVTGIVTLPAGTYRFEYQVGWSTPGAEADKYSAWVEVVSGTTKPATVICHDHKKNVSSNGCSGGVIIASGSPTFRCRVGNSGGNREIKDYAASGVEPGRVTTLAIYKA